MKKKKKVLLTPFRVTPDWLVNMARWYPCLIQPALVWNPNSLGKGVYSQHGTELAHIVDPQGSQRTTSSRSGEGHLTQICTCILLKEKKYACILRFSRRVAIDRELFTSLPPLAKKINLSLRYKTAKSRKKSQFDNLPHWERTAPQISNGLLLAAPATYTRGRAGRVHPRTLVGVTFCLFLAGVGIHHFSGPHWHWQVQKWR